MPIITRNKRKNALVILSGGQDSVTCLGEAVRLYENVEAVSFDYGQRHKRELGSARTICTIKGLKHRTIKIPAFTTGDSFLTKTDLPVEEFDSKEAMEEAGKKQVLDSSFVPNRNATFALIASALAREIGDCDIIMGVTAADYATLPPVNAAWLASYLSFDAEVKEEAGVYIVEKLVRHSTGSAIAAYCEKAGLACTLTVSSKGVLLNLSMEETDELWEAIRRSPLPAAGNSWGDFISPGVLELTGGASPTSLGELEVDADYRVGLMESKENDLWEISELVSKPYLRKRIRTLAMVEKLATKLHREGQDLAMFNPPYPDCSPDFINALERMLNLSLSNRAEGQLSVVCPVMYLTKAEAIHLSVANGFYDVLAFSHTSYDGKYPPTGKNHANLLRKEGFEQSGLPDPLVLRAEKEGLMELPNTSNYTLGDDVLAILRSSFTISWSWPPAN